MLDPDTRTCFHSDLALETWFPIGVLDIFIATFMAHYIGFEESVSDKPFNRFTDLSMLSAIHLDLKDVAKIVAIRRASYDDGPPVKSAILAISAPTYGVARMFEALMEPSPIDVKIFRNAGDAAQWLGVPVTALLADS